jgi:chaperone protein DnaK
MKLSLTLLTLALVALLFVAVRADEDELEGPIIGIDLGTTYSCVGVYRKGRVEIIANDQGNRITPSYVSFTKDGERLVGEAAKNQASLNPTNTVFDIKRLIGRRWDDSTVQKDAKLLPYKVVNKDGAPYVEVVVNDKPKQFSPEQISAMILGKMKEIAENYLGEEVKRAVVTVPAYFNEGQRKATKDAGAIAGLRVERILNEPSAAAIAYGLDEKGEKNILVYDLGGGTFDVSILNIDDGIFEVVSTNGDTHLGGEDFDHRVMEHFMRVWNQKTGLDAHKDKRAVQKLRREVERAKKVLSSQPQARVEIESFQDGQDFSETITRARFEEINMDLFRKTLKPVDKVLEDADMKKHSIQEVVLVGGSTRIPKVQELLQTYFNGKAPNKGINPDEAVAYGAAVQAGILMGDEDLDSVVFLDVASLSQGIETVGGVMTVLIERNSKIPTSKSQIFSTHQDQQTQVNIQVFEGERPMTADNHLLGSFTLDGIKPAPRGQAQIEVTFDIDANGILQVSAEDKDSGSSEAVTITSEKGRLSDEEIQRMLKEAEEMAEEDRITKERVVAKTQLESQAYDVKNLAKEGGPLEGKATEDEAATLEKAATDVLSFLSSNPQATKEEIEEKKGEMEAIVQPIVAQYQGQAGGAGGDDEEMPDHDEF